MAEASRPNGSQSQKYLSDHLQKKIRQLLLCNMGLGNQFVTQIQGAIRETTDNFYYRKMKAKVAW